MSQARYLVLHKQLWESHRMTGAPSSRTRVTVHALVGLSIVVVSACADPLLGAPAGWGRSQTAGVVLGVAGAFLATWVLAAILYGISATDLVTFLVVPLALAAVALTASWIPARRAASLDPLKTLRCE